MGDFAGKNIVVTGGSKGIGRAAVKRFCEEGAHCIIVNRNGNEGQEYVAELRHQGFSASSLVADVSKVSEIKRMTQALIEQYAHIDVLVNSAGLNIRKLALDNSEADWDCIMNINLKGAYFCSVEIGRHMVARGSGAIVSVASLQGHIVLPKVSIYAASKGGILQFTKGLANEWAKTGVRVNSISPAFIDTPLVSSVLADPAWMELIEQRTPMGRVGKPEEVAELIAFLASARASYITGADITIDGGWTAG